MSIFSDPTIQSLLAKARARKSQPEDELHADKMHFSDVGFKVPDLSVFDKVKIDAGVQGMPTQVLTNAEESKKAVDGPYFKVDEFGRKKLDMSKIAIQETATCSTDKRLGKGVMDRLVLKRVDERTPANDINEKKTETVGPKWFDMKAAEITPDLKQDLLIIKNRAALDPKQFYKRDNSKSLPKFFQVGTIVESKADYYSARLTRKQRKETIVDSILSDYDKKSYLKRKFMDIQSQKMANGRRRMVKKSRK